MERLAPSPEKIQFFINKKATMKSMLNLFKNTAYSVNYIHNSMGLKENEFFLHLHCLNNTPDEISNIEIVNTPIKATFISFEQMSWNKHSYFFKFKLENICILIQN